MKENPHNRALLLRLFGEEWLKERDARMMKLIGSKPKAKQLKLNL